MSLSIDENKKLLKDCPICSSVKILHKFTSKDEYQHINNENFYVFLCNSCKTYFLNPIPDEKSIEKYYNFSDSTKIGAYQLDIPKIQYSKIDKRLLEESEITLSNRLYFTFKGIDNRHLDILTYNLRKKIKFKKALDVGCGAGYYTTQLFVKYLKMDKKNITGIDIHPNLVEFGKRLNIRFIYSKIEDFNEYGFDIISFSHVLEHMSNPKDVIKRVYERLTEDGIFFLSLPNSQSLPAHIFRKKWICHNIPRHIFNFSKKGILKLTKDLFDLEFYSAGNIYTCMSVYYDSRILKKIFKNYLLKRIIDSLLFLFNIGDNQNFILKKKKN